ncbi:hypothetical protein Q0V21_31250 [Paenibacillus sp. 11B]|uniref:BC1872 family protein n=1 Tax=unclassified Paenibacillus TaxID=185978 RepID=UPI000CF9A581|nr:MULTISPECIES: hypothetical protein [unclassified Paenibacillus]MDN8593209.1 hypothetical protein [Paenibacillus sp. 11B]PQP80330.1 hypothetical protein C0Q44_28365 [Paenibacillus sp. PCH8]
MLIENHFQKDCYEIMRAEYLQTLTKDEIRRSRIHCEKQLQQFDSMDMEKRNEYIALEVMNWSRHTVEPPFYITQKDYLKVDSFQPAQEIGSAFLVFNYVLVEDKTSLVACGSGKGRFWAVYYEDTFIGVGETAEMAICKASIVINDAVVMKLNTV